VGAWIEIPMREARITSCLVAPFVGAWIEISVPLALGLVMRRRSLRGSVD